MSRPFRFICFTEHSEGIRNEVEILPLPKVPFEQEMVTAMTSGKRRGAWRKVSMMKPAEAGLEGPTLVMDLDVVVAGPLDDLFDYAPGKICMGREWRYRYHPLQPVGGHGSVYKFEPGVHDFLYTDFENDTSGSLSYKGEQKYISLTAHKRGLLEYYPKAWICSFKRQAIPKVPFNLITEPRLPEGCRVMCFHGNPKMEEALVGDGSKLRYRTKPAKWLRQLWLDKDEQDWMP
ncbi:MAG: glycosyl transferase [Pseudomonadota bacterium]